MHFRLGSMLALALSAAPSSTLGEWTTKKDVRSRELRFTDSAGEHVVTFSLTSRARGDTKSRDLLVTHLAGKQEVWRAKDFVTDCEFDLELDLLEGSIEVTDLDGDGAAEVSFLYRLGCRSDVSPLTVKLLMYEGATKYALRGDSRERVGENEFMGGEFRADPAFDNAPAFLAHAKARWKSLVLAR